MHPWAKALVVQYLCLGCRVVNCTALFHHSAPHTTTTPSTSVHPVHQAPRCPTAQQPPQHNAPYKRRRTPFAEALIDSGHSLRSATVSTHYVVRL